MEKGARVKLTSRQIALFKHSGLDEIARRGYVNRKARPVIKPTFNASKGAIIGYPDKSYKEAFSKVANKGKFVA